MARATSHTLHILHQVAVTLLQVYISAEYRKFPAAHHWYTTGTLLQVYVSAEYRKFPGSVGASAHDELCAIIRSVGMKVTSEKRLTSRCMLL